MSGARAGGPLSRWLRRLFGRAEPAPVRVTALREGFFEEFLAGTDFLRRYPHYAGALARMDPIATNTVPVMAVALRHSDSARSRVQLLVNVEWLRATPEFRAGVLLHELQHVTLGHLTDAKFHAVRYPRVMELAMEISANEGIGEPLPGKLFDLARFRAHGIEPGQSTMERYALLASAYEEGRLDLQELWSARMLDEHRPQQAGGCRGPGLGDLIDARSDEASEQSWSRDGGWMSRPTSQRELERMRAEIATHLRGERGGLDDALRDGTQRRVAKELQRVVRHTGTRSELDWRRVLREAFPRRRVVRPDYLRPNRRFPERVGEIPGRTRRPPKPQLLVAVDTSGSMSGYDLDRIAREIRSLARVARLTIVECDAAVHRMYPLSAELETFVGGGDTDFAPVFGEVRGAHPYEGVVYFTDGKGKVPEPSPLPTLWALTHEDPFDVEWGSIVRIGD